jgi:para-nitrobenzyl esterase
MDMIAALKWVKRNIAALGGDPHNVTIFGASAGSQAVNLLMVSPRARGLFSRAIGQSGGKFKPAGSDRSLPEAKGLLKDAERYGATVVARLGTKSLAELRRLPAEAVIAAGPAFPIVDGDVIPKDAWSVFMSGAQNDVPLLVGTTSDEGDSFVSQPLSARRFVEVAHAQAGPMAERLLSVYAADSDAQAATSQRRFETDYGFGWEAWTWARLQSKTGTGPVYAYSFAYRPPYPNAPPYSSWGVPHMAELPYVFQHFTTPWKWTDDDRRIGDLLSSYWVNFARTGDPNGPGLPPWEPFTDARQRMLHIGSTVAMGDVPHRTELGFVEDYVRMLRERAATSSP